VASKLQANDASANNLKAAFLSTLFGNSFPDGCNFPLCQVSNISERPDGKQANFAFESSLWPTIIILSLWEISRDVLLRNCTNEVFKNLDSSLFTQGRV
jgi:hypothetical protein